MKFFEILNVADNLCALLREASGRELIYAVSVDEPIEPQDELHFFKLVSWCYVFLFEASHPTTRYTLSLLRAADPSEHKIVKTALDNVNNLRTVRVHNLSAESRSDDHKKTQADIWILQNGGNTPDWPSCCAALCTEITSAIGLLTQRWRQLIANADDADVFVRDLIETIDSEWPPHIFDQMILSASESLGLIGLDYVKYRQKRLERWRELTGFFETRATAEKAIRAAIHCELEQLFGVATTPSSMNAGHKVK